MPSSPSEPGATTNSASPEKISASALTISQWMVEVMAGCRLRRCLRSVYLVILLASGRLVGHLVAFLDGFLDGPDHVEVLHGQVVVFTFDNALEVPDGVLERDIYTRRAGKHFGHEERLREEIGRASCRERG